jgi:hypothetical protein
MHLTSLHDAYTARMLALLLVLSLHPTLPCYFCFRPPALRPTPCPTRFRCSSRDHRPPSRPLPIPYSPCTRARDRGGYGLARCGIHIEVGPCTNGQILDPALALSAFVCMMFVSLVLLGDCCGIQSVVLSTCVVCGCRRSRTFVCVCKTGL